jgi:hypothetical protein
LGINVQYCCTIPKLAPIKKPVQSVCTGFTA